MTNNYSTNQSLLHKHGKKERNEKKETQINTLSSAEAVEAN
jgi:hypothetical protein